MKKWFYLILLFPLLLGACGEEETGPVPIKAGRDTCERCRMIISDTRFAAEIRGGPENKIWKFDDIGDAITWLQKKPWANDEKTKIWVMDYDNGTEWIEAQKAHYLVGYMTPMAFGFVAFSKPQEKSMSFEEMREIVVQKNAQLNCLPDEEDHNHDPNHS
jgi:nitrous oxide reductase accessory protein NosL